MCLTYGLAAPLSGLSWSLPGSAEGLEHSAQSSSSGILGLCANNISSDTIRGAKDILENHGKPKHGRPAS